jgi:CRISPR-associated exonuclease Cas4
LQHFAFCRRQWALIHIENAWSENLRTVEGSLMHERAHDKAFQQSRGDVLITRAEAIFSNTLGFSGQCDVLEFHRESVGVPLTGRDGLWRPYPVEYKRGTSKANDCDRLQLCAQAMCLEEMLCCKVPEGALYYGESRRREPVEFSGELRETVTRYAAEMHEMFRRAYTPKVKAGKHCNACSLKEICLPKLMSARSVVAYLKTNVENDP